MLRSGHCYEHAAEGDMTLMWRKTDRFDVKSSQRTHATLPTYATPAAAIRTCQRPNCFTNST